MWLTHAQHNRTPHQCSFNWHTFVTCQLYIYNSRPLLLCHHSKVKAVLASQQPYFVSTQTIFLCNSVICILVLHSLFLTQQITKFFIHEHNNAVKSQNFIIRKFKDAKMEWPMVLSVITWNSRVELAVSA